MKPIVLLGIVLALSGCGSLGSDRTPWAMQDLEPANPDGHQPVPTPHLWPAGDPSGEWEVHWKGQVPYPMPHAKVDVAVTGLTLLSPASFTTDYPTSPADVDEAVHLAPMQGNRASLTLTFTERPYHNVPDTMFRGTFVLEFTRAGDGAWTAAYWDDAGGGPPSREYRWPA